MDTFSKTFNSKGSTTSLGYDANSFDGLFEHVLIQTNNCCTRKCKFCYFGMKDENYKFQKLPSKTFNWIIDQLHEVNFSGRVGLFDINEPLTDKRIYGFTEYARDKLPLAWLMIITNGDLLTIQTIKKLEQNGLDQISISVYDQKSMDRLKLIVDSYSGNIYLEIMDFRKEIFTDNRGGNIIEEYKPIKNYGFKAHLNKPCERIYKMLVVKSSGFVVSCFSDFFQQNVMGDAKKEKIIDIWFGDKFRKLRSDLDAGLRKNYSICSKCNYPGKGGFFKRPE